MTPMGNPECIARYFMRKKAKRALMLDIGFDWLSDFQPTQEDYNKMNCETMPIPNYFNNYMNSLATLQQAATPPFGIGVNKIPKERENTMQNIAVEVISRAPSQVDPDASKRQYLENRLDRVQWSKLEDMCKMFGLSDDAAPKTYAEMKARLLAGKFTLPHDRDDDDVYCDEYHSVSRLSWRDPSKFADKAGLAAAKKQLQAAYTTARDTIKVGDLADGLKALNAFEAWQTTIVPATSAPTPTTVQ